jgi:hypothetical protein
MADPALQLLDRCFFTLPLFALWEYKIVPDMRDREGYQSGSSCGALVLRIISVLERIRLPI